MTSEQVLDTFLRFFERHDHVRIPGASIVPKDDPTLLFINSGMAPLKPYFLGLKKPPHPDLCNVQPCIRTVDIDAVGDRQHLTLFEMLGSWSVGHYWKDRAIELAYDLLVNHFKYDPTRLYATVYSGSSEHNIPPDDESAAAWERVGLALDHIVHLGEDNFWGPAGKYGPCGPCTEVFFDTGAEHGPAYRPGGHFDSESRYIEIWNAGVFMEFDKQPDGLKRLALRSVDTGSGLERMLMNLNHVESVYETDRLRPILAVVQDQLREVSDPDIARDAKIMADHMRALSFMLAEGVFPANVGRGYIPRRLIRKCVAMTIRRGLESFEFDAVLNTVVDVMAGQHAVLGANRQRTLEMFDAERRTFAMRISRGFERLSAMAGHSPFRVSGRDALSLFATFGVPLPMIRDFVRDQGGELDEEGFQAAFQDHQEISRGGVESEADDDELGQIATPTIYVGEEAVAALAEVQAILVDGTLRDRAKEGEPVQLVLDRTPFYAEGGGQIGDRGTVKGPNGVVQIEDTVKRNGLYFLHHGRVLTGSIARGESVESQMDADRRRRIRANHSATHLLQSALRTLLGPHVQQAGSRVEPNRLRFDFEHGERVSPEQRRRIEQLVNEYVRRNVPVQIEITSYVDAINRQALAFFGENYGDTVRMVRFDGFSAELCGGSHVHATGDIGMFRIVSESSIASGVRRIVAVTGEEALRHSQHVDEILERLTTRLRVPAEEIESHITRLLDRARQQGSSAPPTAIDRGSLPTQVRTTPAGQPYLFASIDQEDPAALRAAALEATEQLSAVVGLVSAREDKMSVVVTVPKSLTDRIKANDVLAAVLRVVGGHGGGKAHLAQGGGPATATVDELREAFVGALTPLKS